MIQELLSIYTPDKSVFGAAFEAHVCKRICIFQPSISYFLYFIDGVVVCRDTSVVNRAEPYNNRVQDARLQGEERKH
jgi:hypothetical protein